MRRRGRVGVSRGGGRGRLRSDLGAVGWAWTGVPGVNYDGRARAVVGRPRARLHRTAWALAREIAAVGNAVPCMGRCAGVVY